MNRVLRVTLVITLMLLNVVLAVGCSKTETQVKSANSEERPGAQFNQRNPEETKTSLDQLVKEGTITQAQADSVAAYLEKQNEERKNMTREERKDLMTKEPGENQGQPQGQRPTPLGELVTDGTLTQEQADKIAEVLFPRRL